jgi:hypothetical protein
VIAPDVKEAAESQIILNLSNNRSIFLLMTMAEGRILGKGNATIGNTTEPVDAAGSLSGNRLSLDVTALSGDAYKLNMATEGSTILGDCCLAMPDGRLLNATAEGRWII